MLLGRLSKELKKQYIFVEFFEIINGGKCMDFGITIVIRETFNFVMVHLKKKFNNVALNFFFLKFI